MNRIEIETIDPSTGKSFAELEPGGCYQLVERCVNHGWGCPKHGKARVVLERVEVLGRFESEKRDRITITLTEREAELVNGISGKANPIGYQYGQHMDAIREALGKVGVKCGIDCFTPGGVRWGIKPVKHRGYAHAERTTEFGPSERVGGTYDQPLIETKVSSVIRLTMDRDVAVTLKHLLYRVKPTGELKPVLTKLQSAGVYLDDNERFTGNIYWKKRRLNTFECEEGKTYRLVKRPGKNATAKAHRMEWEEVE